MGYQIQYDPERNHKFPASKGRLSLPVAALLCFAAVLLGWAALHSDGLRLLIPGEPEVTRAAFLDLIDGFRAGESAGDAITAFCRQILTEANVR